jgi:pimeloyl-ACP methyl ester carboxylesterase
MELTVDGQSAYVYTGTRPLEPGRETWLFVHGAGMDHSAWILQSRYFAYHGCNLLAVDLPGHGRSAGEPLPDIGASADWLNRLLEAAGVGPAVVVGHSMGALIALELAARQPERVRGLGLLGAGFPMRVAEPLLTAARDDPPAAIEMIVGWGHSPQSLLGGNRLPGLWLAGEARRLLERAVPGVLHADLKACNDYRDGADSAARVRCPTRLVIGRRDLMTPPRAARNLSEPMVDADSVLLDGCGHMMMSERPDQTLDALIGLRDRLSCT